MLILLRSTSILVTTPFVHEIKRVDKSFKPRIVTKEVNTYEKLLL